MDSLLILIKTLGIMFISGVLFIVIVYVAYISIPVLLIGAIGSISYVAMKYKKGYYY